MKLRLPSVRTIQARWWAFAYLALIPTCALVYYFLPGLDPSQFHFYHSTAQYEQALYSEARNIIGQLQTALAQNFVGHYSADFTQTSGWNIPIRDLAITGLRPTQDTIEIHFRLRLQKQTASGPIVAYKAFQATVPIIGQDIVDLRSGTVCKPLLFDSNQLAMYNDEKIDFATVFVPPNGVCYAPALAITSMLNDRLKGYWRAARGFPTDTPGGYWRMLYFSAITITTIGYGDIYPVSNMARVLVALEAILGVVLAGFFLNAIVQERRVRDCNQPCPRKPF
jgi:hypothetical protein